MAISLIAALDENFAIGRKGQLPWHLPDDLRWFKELTLGKYVLMGYNTAVAIGRPLPDRTNLVLSRKHEAPFPGQITVRSLAEGTDLVADVGLDSLALAELAARMRMRWKIKIRPGELRTDLRVGPIVDFVLGKLQAG